MLIPSAAGDASSLADVLFIVFFAEVFSSTPVAVSSTPVAESAGKRQDLTRIPHPNPCRTRRTRVRHHFCRVRVTEVWEEGRLNEANEKGTLVILENFDPSFAASEVEDIVWHVFRENVKVKMIQSTAFSSPLSGQALVLFKTKEAADKAISELMSGSLVLGDGRPIVGRRKFLRKVGAADKFVGHLKIDRIRTHRQREEIKNAVSTSHFAQGNTIEFEMALQWRALQEKSNIWWKALLDGQAKEMEALMKQMKN